MEESVKNELIINERVKGLRAQIASQEQKMSILQRTLVEREEEIEKLKSNKPSQRLMFFCLNCRYCRYDGSDCTCSNSEISRIMIKPDDNPCSQFLARTKPAVRK